MTESFITSYELGNLVKINFADKVRSQISGSFKEWKNIAQFSIPGDKAGERYHEFIFQSSLGPNSVQWSSSDGTADDFPTAQLSDIDTYNANYKELDATVGLSLSMWNRALATPNKYADPLLMESNSTALAFKRELSGDLHGNGLGVKGIALTPSNDGTLLKVILDETSTAEGTVGRFQKGDFIDCVAEDASVATSPHLPGVASGTCTHLKVYRKDNRTGAVWFQAMSAANAVLTVNGVGTVIATDVFYKKGQKRIIDSTSTPADYNAATPVMAGFESLFNNDDRVVHGITMGGAAAGGIYTASGIFSARHIQEGLSDVKNESGSSEEGMIYDQLLMNSVVRDLFIESVQDDRYFVTINDTVRGGKRFGYQHEDDTLMLEASEFCPKNRVRAIPKAAKAEDAVLELRGGDFEEVTTDGVKNYLSNAASGTGHSKSINKYFNTRMVLVCKRPGAVLGIQGYSTT